jgi:TetR/AcrR family transcriptional regulator, transcriptional repressor for nem operon
MKRGMARLRLLEAAMTLVRQKGFAATSLDNLCAAAGLTGCVLSPLCQQG